MVYSCNHLLIKETLPPTVPILFPEIHQGGCALPCYTSNRRSKCRPLYGAGRHAPMPIVDLSADQPEHVPRANRLCHHTKGILAVQEVRQRAVLSLMML
jgi:hypothetical protein